MHILFISPRQCWPAVSGAKLREYHLCKALGAGARVHYLFYTDPLRAAPTTTELPFCEAVTPVPPIRPYSKGHLLRGVTGPTPVSVLNYTTPDMEAAIRKIAGVGAFDLVHLDSIHLAAYEPLLRNLQPKARIVYDWHNIESDLLKQYASHGSGRARRFYSGLTARKMAALERRILHSAFGHIVCSLRERNELIELTPKARIEVIENGVDATRFSATPRPSASRNRLLFVGLMNNHANMAAVIWFTKRIWPGLREKFPQLRFTIVGTDPAPEVRALASEPGVEVTGTVPEVTPYYEEAMAAVVPLLAGSGTRLKILEAMAAGVPAVSTPIGAEGLDIAEGENILIVPGDVPGSQEKWVAAIEKLVPQDELWVKLAAAGRALVESRYGWDVIGKNVFEVYSRWVKTG